MTDHIIGIRRTPEGLQAVISRRVHDYWKALWDNDLISLLEMYAVDEEPFASLKRLPDEASELRASWKFLKKVQRWDDELLFHILVVLTQTMPIQNSADPAPPILNVDPHLPQPKRTAAHPRGVVGNKSKRLKPRSLPDLNLHPYLCDPKNIQVILKKLEPCWPKAIQRMTKKGFPPPTNNTNSTVFPFTLNPYSAWHHPGAPKTLRTKFPLPFMDYMLPSLKGASWWQVREFASLYYQLNLEKDPALFQAAIRLFALASLECVRPWLRVVEGLPPGKRYSFLAALLEHEAWDLLTEGYSTRDFLHLCDRIPYEHLENWLDYMFRGLNRKMSVSYLNTGFYLAGKYDQKYWFDHFEDHPQVPLKIVEDLCNSICDSTFFYWDTPLVLWKRFSQLEHLEKFLKRIPWKSFDSDVNCLLLEFIRDWPGHDCKLSKKENAKWNAIQNLFNPLLKQVEALDPKYRESFLDRVKWLTLDCWDREKDFKEKFPLAMQVLARCSRKPHPTYPRIAKITYRVLEMTHDPARQAYIEAPESSFLRMAKLLESDNKYTMFHNAFPILLAMCPAFTVECFRQFPGKLFKTLTKLGTVRTPLRQQVVRKFIGHQLMKIELNKISAGPLYRLVKKYRTPEMTHPAPKNLQRFLEGELQLSPQRVERYSEKFKTNMLSFLLDILDEFIWQALRKNYPVRKSEDAWEHGLQFISLLNHNRRPLKQFLQEYFRGNREYIDQHPKTRQWVRKHKKLPLDLWQRGILFCRRTEKFGPVSIQMERDPAEILKMGTYVGTCLSLGGDYMYSAVAALLDINKQVLYARDANQKVIARQLVAVSSNDELVCYTLYPENASFEIKKIFWEYDRDFARALGLSLFDMSESEDKKYTVDLILANDWWDDWPWDKIHNP